MRLGRKDEMKMFMGFTLGAVVTLLVYEAENFLTVEGLIAFIIGIVAGLIISYIIGEKK